MPGPLRGELDDRDPEVIVALGQGAAALDLRPARRPPRAQAVDTDQTEEVTEHDLQAITA